MSPESDTVAGLNLEETKLTLGLPGTKRGFSQTFIDLNLGSTETAASSQKSFSHGILEETHHVSNATKPSRSAKAQVIGWPPVRASRRNMTVGSKFVKVAVDGAPYLRKVDLQKYNSYQQLLSALEEMFSCLTFSGNDLNERKLMDTVNGVEYLPTYEDKDGDWMLVGDVPWNMFVESCKRLRLMKSSEAEVDEKLKQKLK